MKKLLSIALFISLCTTIFVGYGVGKSRAVVESRSGETEQRVRIRPSIEHVLNGVAKLNIERHRDSACIEFMRAIDIDSTFAPAYYQLARIYLAESNSASAADSALYYSLKAYRLDTTNMWYLSTYAQSTLVKGEYATSKKLYQEILRRQPRDVNAYRIMALLLQRESKHAEAIALLDSAELQVGQNPYLRAIKRQLYIGTNQTHLAIEELTQSIDQMPYDPTNHIALGDIYDQVGADSLAERSFTTAYRLDSLSAESLASMANFYQRRGNHSRYIYYLGLIIDSREFSEDAKLALMHEFAQAVTTGRYNIDQAEAIMKSFADQYPLNDEAVLIYIRHLFARGDASMVIPELTSRINRGESTINSYKLLINLLSQSGAIDSVRLYIDKALKEYPKQNSLHYDWIYTLASREMFEESISYIKERIAVTPDSLAVELYGLLADQYERLSRKSVDSDSESEAKKRYKRSIKEVYKIYKLILKYDPDNVLVMNNFAYTLSVHGGDLNLAEKLARGVMSYDNENAVYIDTYGWILYKLGRFEEAKVELRRAMTLDKSNNAEILLHFAEVLSVLGEDLLSDHYFGKAKSMGASDEEIAQARSSAAIVKDGLESKK